MRNLQSITLAQAVTATGAVAAVDFKGNEWDSFLLFPVTTGGSANLTFQIEMLSPNGDWHKVSNSVTVSTVGPQTPIQVGPWYPGQQMRANVTAYTSGTLTITGYAAAASGAR